MQKMIGLYLLATAAMVAAGFVVNNHSYWFICDAVVIAGGIVGGITLLVKK